MPIKTLGSLGKIRVGRVTGNTHIFFFGLIRDYVRFVLLFIQTVYYNNSGTYKGWLKKLSIQIAAKLTNI